MKAIADLAAACVLAAAAAAGCTREPPAAAPSPEPGTAPPAVGDARYRAADYLRARERAHAWLDRLEVDPPDLLAHGIKGHKKLAEILDAYLSLQKHTREPAEQARIRARVEELARQARRPEYHNLLTCSDTEFIQNSMSYLRVAWLLEQLGVDTSEYRRQIAAVKPRLDAHLPQRGPWQQAMFAEYYDKFGLEKPPILLAAPMLAGVISRRVPVYRYDDSTIYDLTHEIFVAFEYGARRTQDRFGPEDLAYVHAALPQLIDRTIRQNNPDLTGELLSCMTYLGRQADPAHRRALDFLLDSQNPTGTWGDYEKYRPRYGRYLDQHVYLHTTLVVLGALLETYEGDWPPSG